MLSLWCVFILNILFPSNIYRGYAQAIYLPIQLLAAVVLFDKRPRIQRFALFIGGLLIAARALDLIFVKSLKVEMLLLYLFFFGSIMFEVFRQIAHAKMFTTKIVYAAVCGLLLSLSARAANPPPSQLFYVPFPEDNQLAGFSGINGAAAEFGHMTIDHDGVPCNCGRRLSRTIGVSPMVSVMES